MTIRATRNGNRNGIRFELPDGWDLEKATNYIKDSLRKIIRDMNKKKLVGWKYKII